MLGLFISYRRNDSEAFAGRLADALRSPSDGSEPDQVFLDVDDIAPGVNFVSDMIAAAGQADAVLVVIGRHWLPDALRKPDDAVRTKIEAAISAKVPIYCVMVDNPSFPEADSLPPSLRPL